MFSFIVNIRIIKKKKQDVPSQINLDKQTGTPREKVSVICISKLWMHWSLLLVILTNLFIIIISFTYAGGQTRDESVYRSPVLCPARFNYLTTCLHDNLKHYSLTATPGISLLQLE